MYTIEINEVVVVSNEELREELAKAYVAWAKKKYEGKRIEKVELTFDGDEVDVQTTLAPESFEKIRRITGYLVGTVDRFNNGKRAEERDRVKHM
mgnify:FL=1